ncbi:uncharacterized protein [Epargyreus clarus]|uniref:uncharacterized protein n=1 Tax=Epargyreus clarus TaxID=520877 RepID=UPI003C2E53DA
MNHFNGVPALKMYPLKLILVYFSVYHTACEAIILENVIDKEEKRLDMIIDIITFNWKSNGWTNLFAVGNFSNSFYNKIKINPHTISNIDFLNNPHEIKHVVPYHSNTIVINCLDFDEFEAALTKTVKVPFFHPLSNIILYYHSPVTKDIVAKMFFIFWYHRAINVIIVQYDDTKEMLFISEYNPYTCDYIKFQNLFGCWTARKLSLPIDTYEKSFICEDGCENVPLQSKRRVNNLGTCLGYDTYEIPYNNMSLLHNLKLFEDKGKNLHGCALRAFAVEVLPFLEMREEGNGTFSLHSRDGMLWNTMAERMNFTIDLSLCQDIIKGKFNFEINIQQVFAFIQRKSDLLLYPLYQFDIVIAEVDNTVAIKESGVCFVSHRAGFETIVFDAKFLQNNVDVIIQFIICFFCTWFVFFVFNTEQIGYFSFDQAGKDLINTFRTILSISLDSPPKRGSFRIFLSVAIWSFFVINFSTQAAIISIFSAYKRGKEVDTFEDVLEKDYPIEGVASPDIVLPEDEERFRMINSRRVPIQELFGCVNSMKNDSRRFCVVDCAVGRYFERNILNDKGQQFLHVATGDRIHSHYLNMILHRHSTLTASYNKIARALVEAGLIKKWEQYRFNDIKEEAPINPLNMEDVIGIFKCYGMLAGTSIFIFFVEIGMGMYFWVKTHGVVKMRKFKASFALKVRKLKRKKLNVKNVNDSWTQTI